MSTLYSARWQPDQSIITSPAHVHVLLRFRCARCNNACASVRGGWHSPIACHHLQSIEQRWSFTPSNTCPEKEITCIKRCIAASPPTKDHSSLFRPSVSTLQIANHITVVSYRLYYSDHMCFPLLYTLLQFRLERWCWCVQESAPKGRRCNWKGLSVSKAALYHYY